MTTELNIDGAFVPVGLGSELATPGRIGRADDAGMVESRVLRASLDAAAQRHGGTLQTEIMIESDRRDAARSSDTVMRSSDGGDDIILRHEHRTGDLPIVLQVDEAGLMSWHLPEAAPANEHRSAGTAVFRLRGTEVTAPPHAGPATHRGVVGSIGRKLIEVVVVPVVAKAAGDVLAARIKEWECKHRQHRIRTVRAGELLGQGATVDPEQAFADWGGERGLLLVHGTFSRTPNSFASMGESLLAQLDDRYQGRVLAFDHPTVAVSPLDNAQWLAQAITSRPNVDIISTSRGGLVARELDAHGTIDLGRAVLAACPNSGTPLADTEHTGQLIDAVTNAMGLIPDNPITDIAEVVISILRHLAAGTIDALDGLQAMHPDGDFLAERNQVDVSDKFRFMTSNYEPTPDIAAWAKDTLMDVAFRSAPNDLVVPTSSVLGPWSDDIKPEHLLRFTGADAVSHSGFMRNSTVQQQLLDWLT